MPVCAITKRLVDAAAPGAFLWDTEARGFGVKVTAGGDRVFLIQYRTGGRGSPTKRYTLGKMGSPWTVDSARREAKRVLGLVAAGGDPGAAKAASRETEAKALTVAQLADRFLAEHVEAKRAARTAHEYRRLLARHVLPELGRTKAKDVTRAETARLHHAMKATPYQANRVLAVVAKMMNWCERHGHRPDGSNPCRHVEKYREEGRERFLSPAELARLGSVLAQAEDPSAPWLGEDGRPLARPTPWMIGAVRLLVTTGARLNEILTLRWEHVNLDRGVLDLPTSKTGKKTIHLNAPALNVLAALPWVDSNPHVIVGGKPGAHLVNLEKPWRLIRERAGLGGVRLHDLRHSFASVAAAGGLSLPLIGALLGHTQAATTHRYAHLANDPLKAASDLIGDRLAAALAGGGAAVVPLVRRR